MAEKRMISRSVIETDRFYDMSHVAQALYIHLIMGADDEGLLTSAKMIMRLTQCGEDTLEELIDNGFVYRFPSGVLVITEWRVNNYKEKSDRFKPSLLPERDLLRLDEETKIYHIVNSGDKLDTNCIQSGDKLDTQIRLEERREDKRRKTNSASEGGLSPPKDNTLPQYEDCFEGFRKRHCSKTR